MRKSYRRDEQALLTKCIPVDVLRMLLTTAPELIQIDSLDSFSKRKLLEMDWHFYKGKIDFSKMEQLCIIALAFDRQTFIRFIKWEELTPVTKNRIALRRPSWFRKYDIEKNTLSAEAWKSLLRYDKTLINEAISDMKNPTNVRNLLRGSPHVLSTLTLETLDQSSLSAKQWILLMNDKTIRKSSNLLSAEVLRKIDEDVMLGVLSGEFAKTQHLEKAREHIHVLQAHT